jgi:hypothetical protein
MYFAHSLVVMTTLLLLLFNHSVIAANSQAVSYFESALTACDRGLKMRMPRSRGSLRILTSLWNRYQYNRDLALKYDKLVKDSVENFYNGKFLPQKISFLEAFKLCETDFPEKVKKAETIVAQNIKERELKQQQQAVQRQDLIKNKEAAKREVVLAINEYCANRLNNPASPVSSLQEKYLAAKQKALTIYPQIINQIHQATLLDMGTGKEANLSQSIQDWFNYCDAVFTHQTDASQPMPSISQLSPVGMAMVGPEGPTAPDSKSPAATTSPTPPKPTAAAKAEAKLEQPEEDATKPEDDVTEPDFAQEEYQQVMSQSTADRLKVLKDEGRLPDYVNDDDSDYQKANLWQYENEEQNQCNTYKFAENKLVESKNLSGECPSF